MSTSRMLKCEICQRQFQLLSRLKAHVQTGCTNKFSASKLKNFSCKICGTTFKHLASLETHMLMHNTKSTEHEINVNKNDDQEQGMQNGTNQKCQNRSFHSMSCIFRLLKCLRSLYGKQCGPRSDCSSSLFWVHAVCLYTKFVNSARQLFAADDLSRRHFQMHFFLGALRVTLAENAVILHYNFSLNYCHFSLIFLEREIISSYCQGPA